jgi:hypothetical protein
MKTYARWLFGTAALFNISIALNLLVLRYWVVSPLMPLDPIRGTNVLFANFSGAFVGLFGIVYVLIAIDPAKYRLYIPLGAVGKLLAVACAAAAWLMGAVPWQMPATTGVDLVYAVLFFDYLRRTA